MSKTIPVFLPLLAAVALGIILGSYGNQSALAASSQPGKASAQAPKSTGEVLATVNGIVIGEADVRLALSSSGHKKQMTGEYRKNLLEVIIGRELIYQRAVELGLDANLSYQKKLRAMEAQINAFKRKELGNLFYRHEIAGKAKVSEAEGKQYFEENAALIRTELHVWQMLRREEGLIDQALSELKQGTSFEQIVKKRFPNLPKTMTPWDLGYLRWKEVPESWRSVVYNLKKGQVSGVIRGPKNRFWIIKLIDKRENPEITFQSIKPVVMEVLKKAKIQELREKIDRDLRSKASTVYLKDPVELPEAPEE